MKTFFTVIGCLAAAIGSVDGFRSFVITRFIGCDDFDKLSGEPLSYAIAISFIVSILFSFGTIYLRKKFPGKGRKTNPKMQATLYVVFSIAVIVSGTIYFSVTQLFNGYLISFGASLLLAILVLLMSIFLSFIVSKITLFFDSKMKEELGEDSWNTTYISTMVTVTVYILFSINPGNYENLKICSCYKFSNGIRIATDSCK